MFVNADINKTALIGTSSIQASSRAGALLVKSTSKKGENSVKQMIIELDASKKFAKSNRITVGSNNVLFASGTTLNFECKKTNDNKYRIASYKIEGFQKIIMRDKRPYSIKATIL